NGIGEARLDGCPSVGNVLLNIAIVIDHEEVDTAGPGAAPAAVQTHGILTKGVNTKTDNTLGEAGIEGQNGTLAPRSEERRVGQECRARRVPAQRKISSTE